MVGAILFQTKVPKREKEHFLISSCFVHISGPIQCFELVQVCFVRHFPTFPKVMTLQVVQVCGLLLAGFGRFTWFYSFVTLEQHIIEHPDEIDLDVTRSDFTSSQ